MNARALQLKPRSILTWLAAAAVFAVASVGMAAAVIATTNTTVIENSRHTEYHSIDALRSDSTLIVEGRVSSQEESSIPGYGDVPALPTTISQFEIRRAATAVGKETVEAGQTIRVAQIGTDTAKSETPLLRQGGDYLLFLVLDESGDYFITGSNAGMYEPAGGDSYRPSYVTVDTLPETLRYDEATGR